MIFRLRLSAISDDRNNDLPIDYQYFQSAVIYKILSSSNEDYAWWLHQNGYELNGGKRFKLFCYSRFKFNKFLLNKEQQLLQLKDNRAEWLIGILPERSTREFVQGIFSNTGFTIGDKAHRVSFNVNGLELLSQRSEQSINMQPFTAIYEATSPVCVRERLDMRIKYLSPLDEHYAEGLLNGLRSRYEALCGKPFDGDTSTFHFEYLDSLHPQLVNIKGIRVRGYRYRFRLTAPAALHHIACHGGLGEQCSQGFGFIERREEK